MFARKEKTEKEMTIEKLHCFQGRNQACNKSRSMCDFFNKRNRVAMFSTSILFMFLSLFWHLFDVFGRTNMVLSKPMSLAGDSILFFSSILMFVYQIIFWKKKQYKPIYFYTAYYALIIFSVFFLSVGRNMGIVDDINKGVITTDGSISVAGFLTNQDGICLSTLLLLSICLAPLPKKRAGILLAVLGLVEVVLPGLPFMPGHEVYSFYQHIITRVCFALIYLITYNMEVKRCLLERNLELISYTDEITKALNRTALETYLDIVRGTKEANNVGIILLDIDDFKKYNDSYSHPEGDKVLAKVISIALETIDKKKQLLFRYGGEEFVILIPNSNKDEVISIANNVRQGVINANIERNDNVLYPYVTLTLGCDVANVDNNFFHKVDEQLYIGKRNKKNCVVFDGEVVSK